LSGQKTGKSLPSTHTCLPVPSSGLGPWSPAAHGSECSSVCPSPKPSTESGPGLGHRQSQGELSSSSRALEFCYLLIGTLVICTVTFLTVSLHGTSLTTFPYTKDPDLLFPCHQQSLRCDLPRLRQSLPLPTYGRDGTAQCCFPSMPESHRLSIHTCGARPGQQGAPQQDFV
jgi:hypothetical protein